MSDDFKLPAPKRKLAKSVGCPFCNVTEMLHGMSLTEREAIEDEAIAIGYVYGVFDKKFIDATSHTCAFHRKLIAHWLRGACELFGVSVGDLVDLLDEAEEG